MLIIIDSYITTQYLYMNNIIYKIKNKIFSFTKESLKIQRPKYDELIKYQNFKRNENNKLIISFAAGRSGQNWFSKIFNSHLNWIGTTERFADYEAFYRYICYYNIPVDKEGFFKLFELAIKRDFAKYQNTLISSPYFCFGVDEMVKKLNPNYIFFNLRDPITSIESLHGKGVYLTTNHYKTNSPLIDISNGLYSSFSRIVPKCPYFLEWKKLTRIGKLAWFWATTNKSIYDSFEKINNVNKYFVKLKDINQNYDFYKKLSIKFKFKNHLNAKNFYNVINKAPNKGSVNKYEYKDWNNFEKKEFENIIKDIFPNYDDIKTNI